MADRVALLADQFQRLTSSLPQMTEQELRRGLNGIKDVEQSVDVAFEKSATEIMDLEVFPVDSDYFLEIAKQLDRMSDLLERSALLLDKRHKLERDDSELLENAATQVYEIAQNVRECISGLGSDPAKVKELCEVIGEREKAVDRIRDHYNEFSLQEGYALEKRLWLKEVLGNMDLIADIARDLTITLRVVSGKLDRQARFDVKRGVMR